MHPDIDSHLVPNMDAGAEMSEMSGPCFGTSTYPDLYLRELREIKSTHDNYPSRKPVYPGRRPGCIRRAGD